MGDLWYDNSPDLLLMWSGSFALRYELACKLRLTGFRSDLERIEHVYAYTLNTVTCMGMLGYQARASFSIKVTPPNETHASIIKSRVYSMRIKRSPISGNRLLFYNSTFFAL